MSEIVRYKSTINGNANTPNRSTKVIDNRMSTYLSRLFFTEKSLNFRAISGTSETKSTEKMTTSVDKMPSRSKISASKAENPSVPNPNYKVSAMAIKKSVLAGVGKPIKCSD